MSHSPVAVAPGLRFSREEVAAACRQYAPFLKNVPPGIDPAQLMWAIALNESLHIVPGFLDCPPRFEHAYYFGGDYCDEYGTAEQRMQYKFVRSYGSDAAKSYGPWQVMFLHCHGAFRPEELAKLENCAHLFVLYWNDALERQKPRNLEEIGQMYNGGHIGAHVPLYCARLANWYAKDRLSA
jgi:hypothetical protein